MTTIFVHFRETKTKEETLVGKHLSFMTIRTFVSKNMVKTLEHDLIFGKDNNKKPAQYGTGF
jgi:hypothetical protein